MDSALEQRLDAIAALLLLLFVIEAYKIAGSTGILLALAAGVLVTYWTASEAEATS
ncbi:MULTISPECIES: hypothetical protein [Haloferax]|uniref:Uncharacterized protein n=1 Tax=Haloferax mediterranei (strain ATCC 33500 / DSM 1411 / JCM 8866 / NBRC 14739 / NCIMB 2177 / R-4) TaxID=523841 RepID=I3R279_HALMT|nr:hypothetical protein [Haloferax mediterranei]AFK18339.1 hypothetical protein HFX_0615 [Haloferax mediterranei ATCC 33500]EMA02390.1 hypothetical protein C439_07405 [Haloferax mediterranei ATCC 33500]MDX5988428.1 hypothetical protein [Haloferax mediterranei ATCC 33500]